MTPDVPPPIGTPRWQEWIPFLLARLRALSSHRLSVSLLLAASVGLFGTVLFIALPSARVRVWPKVNLLGYTANVLLTVSGSSLPTERHPTERSGGQTLPLLPVTVTVHHALTFDEVSKDFLGENAEVTMTFVNESKEPYSLRAGTRLVNQAGMIFRTLASVTVPPATAVEPGLTSVRAQAEPEDLYGEIVGERGNVPAGLKWELQALPLEERTSLYARNAEAATGGTTAYGMLLQEEDLTLAEAQLRQELLRMAKARVEEELEELRVRTGQHHVILQYDVLTSISFSGMLLPLDLLGQPVTSFPVEGALTYGVLAYNKDDLLRILLPGLKEHIGEDSELLEGSVMREGISVHVIQYDDHFQWVKVTAELTGKQRSVLSPISLAGRLFGERVREAIRGKSIEDAERIIQNFPEVDRVEVAVWPPWQKTLPSLPSNILILPQ